VDYGVPSRQRTPLTALIAPLQRAEVLMAGVSTPFAGRYLPFDFQVGLFPCGDRLGLRAIKSQVDSLPTYSIIGFPAPSLHRLSPPSHACVNGVVGQSERIIVSKLLRRSERAQFSGQPSNIRSTSNSCLFVPPSAMAPRVRANLRFLVLPRIPFVAASQALVDPVFHTYL
jgi:hypothetical protein